MARLAAVGGALPRGLAAQRSLRLGSSAFARASAGVVRFNSNETTPHPPPPPPPRRPGASFQGQLTQSISQRLERERADLERLARVRKESPVARNFTLTFGTAPRS